MSYQPHNAYLESRVLSADPIELIRLMYQAAIAEVRSARAYLQAGEIRGRSKAISKASAILTELTVSLDRKLGGEYAERLADLYGYMMRKLTDANFKQSEESLAEVLGLLTTLLEGWEGMQRQLQSATAADSAAHSSSAWAQSGDSGYARHAWSF